MKAYIAYAPHHGGLVDIPEPELAPDEALIRVEAASVCHSDLDIMDGHRVHLLRMPVVLGHEFAGRAAKLGRDVRGIDIGQRYCCEGIVWCGNCRFCRWGDTSACENYNELGCTKNGGFAEFCAVPAHMLHPIHNLSADEASNIEPAGNGYHAAKSSDIREGHSVVVIGPGPIGLYALQFAALYKPEKLIMAGTREERLAAARALGATHTVNIRECEAYEAIMDITSGKGADRVIQCATTASAVELGLRVMGKNARLAIEGHVSMDIPVNFGAFIEKPLDAIVGVCGVTHQNYIDVIALAEAGKVNFGPIITHRFALGAIGEVFQMMRDKAPGLIKAVLHP